MKNTPFDIIVNYLSKFQGKSIDNEKIKDKLQNILDKEYTESKMYKMIYYLKIRGYLVNLKKNLFFVKSPADEPDEETLANKLAKQEYRQLHLADHQHLKLITKYLNNEAEIFYDGQKNKACDPLITEEGCCVQTANETLVKTYKKELENFETFFLAASFSEKEDELLKQLISLSQERKI